MVSMHDYNYCGIVDLMKPSMQPKAGHFCPPAKHYLNCTSWRSDDGSTLNAGWEAPREEETRGDAQRKTVGTKDEKEEEKSLFKGSNHI